MSLISEGLKKAHLEAQRQDRQQRRLHMGAGSVDVPPHTVSPLLVMVAAALGGALVVATGAVYLRESAPTLRPATLPPARVQSVAPQPAVGVAAPPVVPAPRQAANAETTVIATPSVAPAPKKKIIPRPADAETPRSADVAEKTFASDAETTRSAQADAASVRRERPRLTLGTRHPFTNGETYASPISAPGGIEVTLSGISTISGNSVAIMNGSIVRVGSTVGPFRVEAIERGRVQLRYLDVEFWIAH